MHITYRYYRFPNKEAVPSPEKWPNNVSYFHVGSFFNNDAEYNEYGDVIKFPTPKPGWHINVSYNSNPLINLDFIKEYEISVQTPSYLWLGQKTS